MAAQPLLSRQVPYIFVASIATALLLSFAAHFVFSRWMHGFCKPTSLPGWITSISFICSAIFTANIALQCMFSFHVWLSSPRVRATLDMRLMILVIHLIAVSSQYATSLGLFGTLVCIDGFGVHSLLVQWPEWFVTVPLLALSAMSMPAKDVWSYSEIALVISIALMILSGFLIIIDHNRKRLYFALSTTCMISILLFRHLFLDEFQCHVGQSKRSFQQEVEFYRQQQQANWRHKMLLRLFIICCFFPIVYIAVAVGVINADLGIAGFLVGSLLGKLFFSTYLAQCYSELYADIELHRTVEQVEEKTRRKLLRFMFHELRSPLNSLSMGVQMLSDSLLNPVAYTLLEDDSQILETVQRSTKKLTDHIDQVLSLHRAQAGELIANVAPFHLRQWAKDIHAYASSALYAIGAKVKMSVSKSLPKVVVGDAERTELMIQSLFSYLVLHLKPLGKIDMIISGTIPVDFNARVVKHSNDSSSMANDLLSKQPTAWVVNVFLLFLQFIINNIIYILDLLFFSNLLSSEFHQTFVKKKTEKQQMIDLYVLVQSDDFTLSAQEMAEHLLKPYADGKLRTNNAQESQLEKETEQKRQGTSQFDLSLAAEILALVALGDISILQAQRTTDGKLLATQGVCLHLKVGTAADIVFSPLDVSAKDVVDKSKEDNVNLFEVKEEEKEVEVEHDEIEQPPVRSIMSAELVPSIINTKLSKSLEEFVDSRAISPNSNASPASLGNSSVDSKVPPCTEQPPVILKAPAPLIKLRALVVDDTPSNSKMLGYLLRKKGQETTIVDNGQAAVDLIQSNKSAFDIIFIDFTMPVMDGPTAVSQIRSLGYDKHIVGATGNVLSDDIDCFINAGVDAVLIKPLLGHDIDLILVHLLHHGILSHREQYRLALDRGQIQMILK